MSLEILGEPRSRLNLFALCVCFAFRSAQVSLAATITVDADCPLKAAITAAQNDSNSHDTDCTAGSGSGGGLYLSAGSHASLSHVTVYGNTASGNTQASQILITGAGASAAIRNSIVCDTDSNTADFPLASGGSLTQNVGNVIGQGGSSTGTCGDLGSRVGSPEYYVPPSGSGSGSGGGLFLQDGTLTISQSSFISNSATDEGGGLYMNDGTLTALGRTTNWFFVDYHGERGWISASYSTEIGSCG